MRVDGCEGVTTCGNLPGKIDNEKVIKKRNFMKYIIIWKGKGFYDIIIN